MASQAVAFGWVVNNIFANIFANLVSFGRLRQGTGGKQN
jgi:hypothetical protein